MPSSPIAVRPSTAGDLPFFFSATLRANYHYCPMNREIPQDVYYPEHKRVLERLLQRPTTCLHVACDGDDPGFIMGFALTEPGVLHFTYVKKALRRFGVMRQLLAAADISLDTAQVSHWTSDIAAMVKRRRAYNPYLLMPKEGGS